jgi:putative heme-binding domain-containing protein
LKVRRVLDALAELSHARSSDPWFRMAILSSVADRASAFFHMVVAKGSVWTDPQLLVETSVLIGGRHNPAELALWFGALPKAGDPEKLLAGLSRGLRLADARNLKAPGAEQAFGRLLSSGNDAVRQAAWEASRHFELASLIERARAEATSTDLALARRIQAIGALRGGRFDSVAPVLEKILDSHPAPEVEAAVIDSLGAFDEPAAGKVILDSWRGYSPDARRHAIAALLDRRDRIPLLLNAVEDGMVERSALDAAARSHLYADSDPAIAAKARVLLETAGSDRAQVVAQFLDALKLNGDVARGKKLFDDNCAKCHEPRRHAGRVGPDLSGINNKSKQELITSILNPSYAIEPRFVDYIVTTNDGRMYDGVIAGETQWAVTLRGGSDEGDVTVLRKNIASIRASSVSLMPDGLEENLGKQGIADVIAYLRGGL